MDADLQNKWQDQFNMERQNAVEYQCRGDILDGMAYSGMAHFMRKSAKDERHHAQIDADFLLARNIIPQHLGLKPVLLSVATPLQLFTQVHDLEVSTTDHIKDLYNLAEDANDPQSCQALQFFLEEQTRSVKETWDMVQELQRAEGNEAAMIALDKKYGKL